MASNVMERLRTETRDLHTSAEQHAFQKSMIQATITREAYGAWIGQMYCVHKALDDAIHDRRRSPVLAAVHNVHFQVPYLLEDLAFFGIDPESVEPTPATATLVQQINIAAGADEPVEILGFFYVLEGANNGNRFIARALREPLGFEPRKGDRYLDPYGDEQPVLWQRFKDEMGEIEFTDEQADALVAAAARMFKAVIEISDDVAGVMSRA